MIFWKPDERKNRDEGTCAYFPSENSRGINQVREAPPHASVAAAIPTDLEETKKHLTHGAVVLVDIPPGFQSGDEGSIPSGATKNGP